MGFDENGYLLRDAVTLNRSLFEGSFIRGAEAGTSRDDVRQ